MFRILVAEDDLALNKLIETTLVKNGYQVITARDGTSALCAIADSYVDLVVSDIMMPRMDGYQLAKAIRERDKSLPILFISVKDKFVDKEKGFQLGIDDYMVKPLDTKELLLRIGALLRRAKIATEHKLTIGETVLDYDNFSVTNKGVTTELPQKEFLLLFKFLSYPGKIFTRNQLMDEFWGPFSESTDRTVDVHITKLRDRFKSNDDFEIVTVRGLGYKAVKK